jgi:hypothetical protein
MTSFDSTVRALRLARLLTAAQATELRAGSAAVREALDC